MEFGATNGYNAAGHHHGDRHLKRVRNRGPRLCAVSHADPHRRCASGSPNRRSKTVQSPPPPVPIQPAPGGVFDGMYRVDLEYTKTTVENGKLATTSADGAEWWAFRSACSDSGCVANGALLDDSNHQEAAGSATVLQLANGRWEDAGGHPMLISCQWARGGENVVKSSWFSQQNPDGAVTEERTLSVTTNGCGDAETTPWARGCRRCLFASAQRRPA